MPQVESEIGWTIQYVTRMDKNFGTIFVKGALNERQAIQQQVEREHPEWVVVSMSHPAEHESYLRGHIYCG